MSKLSRIEELEDTVDYLMTIVSELADRQDEAEAYQENLEYNVEELTDVVFNLDQEVEDIVELINSDIEQDKPVLLTVVE